MILVIKYEPDCTTLFDKLEDNGTVTAVDAIAINSILENDFPIFDLETESAGAANERKAGEWGGTFSFMQNDTSANDDNINNFFRGGTRNYKYIILMQDGLTIFHGTFNSSDLGFDFTYNENKYHVQFIARDLIEEWSKYLNTLHSYFPINSGSTFYFEGYLHSFHLKNFNLNFIGGTSGSLSNRVGQTVVFDGTIYNAIGNTTDWRNVSRLETFKGLARGLGFTYDLSVCMDLEAIAANPSQWYPRSFIQINIDWISEADTENAIEITLTKKHLEKLTPLSKRYLFIGYRDIISTSLPEVDANDFTAVRGILFDGEDVVAESDSNDNFNPIYAHYPFFSFTENNPFNSFRVGTICFAESITNYRFYLKDDIAFIDLDKYAGGFLNTVPGAVSYARIFRTSNGFLPIQRFVVQQYKRYLQKAGKKVKTIEIPVTSSTYIKNYKYLNITDDQEQAYYYVNKITGYNSNKKFISLESTQV